MAINSQNDLIAALGAGQTWIQPINKNVLGTTAEVAGVWYDHSKGAGNPAWDAVIGSGTNLTFQAVTDTTTTTADRLTPAAPSLPIANTTAPVGQICYSGTGVGKYGPFIPLQAGDNGILSVQTINLSATMTSGVLALVVCKPIGLPLPITTLGVPAERDYFNQLPSMPIIYDGACLSWLQYAGAAHPVNTPYYSAIQTVWKT